MSSLTRRPLQGQAALSRFAPIAVCLTTLLLLPRLLLAQQSQIYLAAGAEHASRTELERLVGRAESLSTAPGLSADERSQLKSTADFVKGRLQLGDFEVGDRIALWVQDQPTLTDTFAVGPGRRLQLPNMDDLNLGGVLRSELTERIRAHIAQYVRDPVVRATPLVRLSILGAVAHPGYYALPANLPVADWIMRAGGPTADGDLEKVQLRHTGEQLVASVEAGSAIATGATIDQLNLRSGDEVVVAERPRIAAISVFQVLTGLAGVAVAFLAMQSSRHH